jgi:hypothetical protein
MHQNDVENILGAGGSLAFSLAKMHVLGDDEDTVKNVLNSCISPTWEQLKLKDPELPRACVGQENDYWHSDVVRLAMCNQYGPGNFLWRRHALLVDLAGQHVFAPDQFWEHYCDRSSYVVDGILGPNFFDPCESKTVKHANWKRFDPQNKEWRHCVALAYDNGGDGVEGHMLFSSKNPDPMESIVISCSTNKEFCKKPNYFHTIFKVYEVFVPTMDQLPTATRIFKYNKWVKKWNLRLQD